MKTVLKVKGMACGGCSANVERAIASLEGVENVMADHETGEVNVQHDGSVQESELKKKVTEAGYDPQ